MLDGTCLKHVILGVDETLRTCLTTYVAIVCRDCNARFSMSESLAPKVTDIYEPSVFRETEVGHHEENFFCERQRSCATFGAIVTRETTNVIRDIV